MTRTEKTDTGASERGKVHEFPGWFHNHLPIPVFLSILAMLTGLLSGAAAFVLKKMIAYVSGHLTATFHAAGANFWFLILPVAGIVLTGIFQRYVLHREISHGEEKLDNDLKTRRYRLPFELTYAPLLASTLTLGFGGSAGSEGPVAYAGGAIGSNVGRLFKVSPTLMKTLLACGAAGGIAGIFMAPVGGALFAFEVLCVGLTASAVLAVFVTSVTAALTTYALMGCTTDIVFASPAPFDWGMIPWLILFGLFCGLYSRYYAFIMTRMRMWFDSFRNPWLENLVSGGILAVLVFLFPALFGEGYGFITKVLAGNAGAVEDYSPFAGMLSGAWGVVILVAGMALVKAFATSASNSGGGVAGDFAPTLFAGCVVGYVFAAALNGWFGLSLSERDFAFFGMAAVMSGAVRAPLMAMFITVEMAQCYGLLLPVALVAGLSYMIVRIRPQKAG